MARFRTGARTALRWIFVLTLSVTILGLVSSLHPSKAHAEDTGGYPWANAPGLDGACNHDTYNWGYALTNGHCPSIDPSCLDYPYPSRQHPTAGMGDPWGYSVMNCTSYVAWKINQVLGINISGWGNAAQWADAGHAPAGSIHNPSTYMPVAGDIAQWGPTSKNKYGHVAYVYAVTNGVASLDEYNALGTGQFSSSRTSPGSAGIPTHYIHLGKAGDRTPPPVSTYADTIVQWDGDTKQQKTAWLVSPDLKRYWIPDSSTFSCLRSRGTAVAGPISSAVLNQLPDQTGRWAECGSNTLGINQYLFRGSSLVSSNGQYHLELQRSDGDLVLYDSATGAARWSNATSSDYLVMQSDGDLATFSYKGGETWASNTGNTGASYLIVGNDGNLALYAAGGILKWSTLFDSNPVDSKTTPTATTSPTPTLPSGGSSLRQFYVANGFWTAFDVSAATGVTIVGDPFENAGGGNVWARDTKNHLRQFYVQNGAWVAFDVSAATGVAIASDISNGPSGVVARDTNNHLRQFYVQNGAWVAFDVSNATGVTIVGDPYENVGGGNVWARDTNNHLRQFYVQNGAWVAFDVSNATGVAIASDISNGPSGVVARDIYNHLRQFYVQNGAWVAFDISAAAGVAISGNPYEDIGGGIWARDIYNHLRQFYVQNGAWVGFDVSAATGVAIVSDPNSGASDVFACDTNNHLRQFYVQNGAWVAFDVSAVTGVVMTGNPAQGPSGEFVAS